MFIEVQFTKMELDVMIEALEIADVMERFELLAIRLEAARKTLEDRTDDP